MVIGRLTTLAFSLYSNKGAYALLLGAGISRPAHMPSTWDIENALIERIAATRGVVNQKNGMTGTSVCLRPRLHIHHYCRNLFQRRLKMCL